VGKTRTKPDAVRIPEGEVGGREERKAVLGV
jgi:hypothetical protein